jgi:23S rRNA (adenine2030-N6)-methyltransferase
MLSYQHAYHAGNAADVHKHAALAWMLAYLTQKPKPLSYIETHAGRGLYDLGSAEARRTGEAGAGIATLFDRFAADHPYRRVVAAARAAHGPQAYPGSPLIAQSLLRPGDRLHLAELHPQEHAALRATLAAPNTRVYRKDGFALAQSLTPPEPRRGLMLVDPSWEVKDDYAALPRFTAQVARKWPVGIVVLWYPLLRDARHRAMIRTLTGQHEGALCHEVGFPPARQDHGMTGSGLFVINPPWGLEAELARLADSLFHRRSRGR